MHEHPTSWQQTFLGSGDSLFPHIHACFKNNPFAPWSCTSIAQLHHTALPERIDLMYQVSVLSHTNTYTRTYRLFEGNFMCFYLLFFDFAFMRHCFQARVHPKSTASELSLEQVRVLLNWLHRLWLCAVSLVLFAIWLHCLKSGTLSVFVSMLQLWKVQELLFMSRSSGFASFFCCLQVYMNVYLYKYMCTT